MLCNGSAKGFGESVERHFAVKKNGRLVGFHMAFRFSWVKRTRNRNELLGRNSGRVGLEIP